MMDRNVYFNLLQAILIHGEFQQNKKGRIQFLIDYHLPMTGEEVDRILREYPVARKKLRAELLLYLQGETRVSEYQKAGIQWWNYCEPELINTYPTYYQHLPALIDKINKERRPSKNYMLFIGANGRPTSQLPCLSLMQFQIKDEKLYMTVYQRSADSNLGLPSDIYQCKLVSEMLDFELAQMTFFIGNAHIYENNLGMTRTMLLSGEKPKFNLNV